jgi:hypothetical protein
MWAAATDNKAGWTVVSAAAAGVLGSFGPTVSERLHTRQETRRRAQRRVDDLRLLPLKQSVAWLLHPQSTVVRFFGRSWQLRELENWLTAEGASTVRLLVAPGGVGKSRLAQQLVSQMAKWRPMMVRPEGEAEAAAMIAEGSLSGPVLLVVDYAETRDPVYLAALLCAAYQQARVRVLLLARTAGAWWTTLSSAYPQQGHVVDALTVKRNVLVLPARVEPYETWEIIEDAAAAFAAKLGRPEPLWRALAAEGFAVPDDAPVLRLHAEALIAVLGRSGGYGGVFQGRYDRHDVFDEVLLHEARYWRGCARRLKLLSQDALLDQDGEQTLWQLAGLGTLFGAANEGEIVDIVRRAPLVAARGGDVGRWANWLSALYPSNGPAGSLGTLQPSMLAEVLAVRVLTQCTVTQRIGVFRDLTGSQAAHAMTVLGRACEHQADAPALIKAAVTADPLRIREALSSVISQLPEAVVVKLHQMLAPEGSS